MSRIWIAWEACSRAEDHDVRSYFRPMKPAGLWIALLWLGCTAATGPSIDPKLLRGPWFMDGPSFELVIHERTILFEVDMKEHAYRLEGDVLIIEMDEGDQRQRILRLTKNEMEWRNERFGTVSVFYRKGIWERSSGNELIDPRVAHSGDGHRQVPRSARTDQPEHGDRMTEGGTALPPGQTAERDRRKKPGERNASQGP